MDPNTVVLEISSDEDGDWNDHDGRGIADGGDDHTWLAQLLDEVNKESYGDDSDEVVVVSEVSPSEKKPGKKSKLKSSLVDLDDDCVVLDGDPDKPAEVRDDKPNNGNDDSDDVLVVSEKGQVACRDYPHPRHLCIKFPFSSTPNQSHCNQCYCYVCDSLAPCVYWGNGSATIDHCHATDKDEFWKSERKNTKNWSKGLQPDPKVADASFSNQLPSRDLNRPAPTIVHPQNQILSRPSPTHARHSLANFRAPNIINHNRSPAFAPRNKFRPDLVSQLLLRTNGARGHQNNNLGTQLHRPVFKRTGSVPLATTANRHMYSYRGNFGNPNRQQNYHVNGVVSGSGPNRYSGSSQPNAAISPLSYPPQSQTYTSSTVNPLLDQPLPPQQPQFSNPSFQPQVNPNFFQENLPYQPQPQPHLVSSPSQPQPAPCQPGHLDPSQTRVDNPSVPSPYYTQNFPNPTMDPSFSDHGFSWDPSDCGAGPVNEPGLAEYRYDWIFDDQPVEPGFMEGPGPYELSSSDATGFIDTGPIFYF